MIEEYIDKKYIPINKETIITWLKEDIDFSDSRKINADIEKEMLDAIEQDTKYKDFNSYIDMKISVCERNRECEKSNNRNTRYWDINIELYNELRKLLNSVNDYQFKELENGQLTLF